VPQSDDAQAHYVLEYSGRGPKAYLNLWLGQDVVEILTECNWVLHDSAVELWRRESTDEEIIDVLLPVNELRAEVKRLRARLDVAERLIEVVRAREIGTAGGVGAAFEAYDAL